MYVVNLKRRASVRPMSIVVLCAALISVLLLPLPTATAQWNNPDADNVLEIHKFEQPVISGAAASGLRQNTDNLTPVSGATFITKRVPGIDLTTNKGQRDAAALTIDQAAAAVLEQPVAAKAITDVNGDATLKNLRDGLYYVQETGIPAGFTGAAPFLVALPLTHPTELDAWLNTVHVYPKNARVGINLDVFDQDAVKLGDTVNWVSRSTIPLQSTIDGYRVEQVINPKLELTGSTEELTEYVTVTIEGVNAPSLIPGVDYRLTYSSGNRTLVIDLLESGLHKLEQAIVQDPSAQVRVDYGTIVKREGVHTNEAVLYPSRDAIEKKSSVKDTAVSKWGPLSVTVFENGDPSNLIPGASFQLFLTPQDAFARRNPVTINGVSEWITDEDGRLIINGLRFSEFANGLDRESSDPLFRDYWVVPINTPGGWSWVEGAPQGGAVYSDVDYQTLTYVVERTSGNTGPGGEDTPTRSGLIFGWIPIFWDFGSSSGSSLEDFPGETGSVEEPTVSNAGPQEGTSILGRDGLASTGAQVTGLILFAIALIGAGLFLVLGKRCRKEDAAD